MQTQVEHTVKNLKGIRWLEMIKGAGQVNWALFDQALVSGVNFLTGILLARFLGLAEFGRFSLVWMVLQFGHNVQAAIIVSPMMSVGPLQLEEEEPSYYGAVMIQQFIFSTLTFILVSLGTFGFGLLFPEWGILPLAFPLACVFVGFLLQEFLRRYFFTVKRPKAAFVNDAISYLGQLVALLVLYFTVGLDTVLVLWVIAITSAIAAAIGFCVIGEISIEEVNIRRVVKRHWDFSKWLLASVLMQWLSGNYLLISAGAWLGVTAVGALKAAQNIIGVTHVLFSGLSNYVPVKLGQVYIDRGLQFMEGYLFKISGFGILATLLMISPALLFPDWVLNAIYGSEFTGFGWLLWGYALVYVFVFAIQQVTFGLRTLESTRPVFLGYLFSGLAGVMLAYPLIQTFGLAGVIGGLLLLNMINIVCLVWGYKSKREELKDS